MGISRTLGVDLAWKDGPDAPETGVVALEADGTILDAGWTRGVEATRDWIARWSTDDTLVFVDASLLVDNPSGQRPCETAVARHYMRWKVAANSTNLASPRLAGVRLLAELRALGFTYDDGLDGPPVGGRWVSECYPYTTIVGTEALGYEVRPVYKRKPKRMRSVPFRELRAAECNELIRRVSQLVDPALRLESHPATASLLEASPLDDRSYKHREDLLDAVLCAWTAQVWLQHGTTRVQPLRDLAATHRPQATIMAAWKGAQRQQR